MAREDRTVFRRLAARFPLQAPPKELMVMTRQAIADATAFDERWANYNFDYDHDAYEEVERNLRRLVQLGHLRPAMELSLELMDKASHQVGMSDEGLMTDEIEACLEPVLTALQDSDLPPAAVAKWCTRMVKADRVGFICDQNLQTLLHQLK